MAVELPITSTLETLRWMRTSALLPLVHVAVPGDLWPSVAMTNRILYCRMDNDQIRELYLRTSNSIIFNIVLVELTFNDYDYSVD